MAAKRTRQTADTMAARQRDISVSEFFAKNRHLLGFDNPRKALLTTVKEAVDNSLDACEEAEILPDITVRLDEITPPPSPSKSGRYRITITDNGPGIVRKQVENIFGKLLYGSKFHRLKMSRGQQGIGISAAGMYGLMTTGKPMVIVTKPKANKPAHHIELAMDTTKNKPEVTVDRETDEHFETSTGTGTQVAIELEARYVRGKTSVEAYLEQTAIANPHARITFIPPDKAKQDPELETAPDSDRSRDQSRDREIADAETVRTTEHADRIDYPRAVNELPPETVEIKPHPYGVELGTFLQKLKMTPEKQLSGFFKNEFSRVPPAVVKEITAKASTKTKTVTGQSWIRNVDHDTAEKLFKALQDAKLRSPPTDCLAPIGVRTMLAGLLKGVRAEFYTASTRSPAVYRGNPFQIEAAVAFGGDLPGDEPARIIRFANRVPLLYQQSACCSFKSAVEASWKNYGLSQPRGSLPVGPLVVMIHMASVWVPFTSESKEAIADYDDIRKEMRLALQECGRKLGTYLRKRQKMRREGQKRDVFARYIGEIARSCSAITGSDAEAVYTSLLEQARRRTEIADAILDEDGKVVGYKGQRDDGDDMGDDVIIVRDDPPGGGGGAADTEDNADATAGEDAGTRRENRVAEPKPSRSAAPKKQRVKKKVRKKVRRGAAGADGGLFS